MQKYTSSLPGSESPRVTASGRSSGLLWFSRSTRALAAVAALTLACSCSKEPPPAETTPPPTPEATPVPTPKPTPATPTPSPTATPVVHHYAAEGVYYVTEDVSVRLKAGIMGVSAGTQVKLLKDNGDMLQVTDGTTQFDIKKSQVTNDLDEAAVILKRTRAQDAASDAVRAEQEAVAAKQQREQLEYLKTHPLAQPTPEVTPRR